MYNKDETNKIRSQEIFLRIPYDNGFRPRPIPRPQSRLERDSKESEVFYTINLDLKTGKIEHIFPDEGS